MWIRALVLLLFASTASAQTTLYLRNGSGLADCAGADDDLLETSRGSTWSQHSIWASSVDHNWTTFPSAQTLNGTWGCTMSYEIASGGGSPSKMTVLIERVDSSCVVQEEILNEQSGTLTRDDAQHDFVCTGTSASIVFAAGEGIMLTVQRTNGSQTILLNYNDADVNDSEILTPTIVEPTPTATPTASPTATPTATPTASPTATPTASPTATASAARRVLIIGGLP